MLGFGEGRRLLARHLFSAMLTGLGALFDDFRTERALPRKKPRMNFSDTFIDFFLDKIVPHF